MNANPAGLPCALGLDVGGTGARWMLLDASGTLASGVEAGFSGARMHTDAGRAEVRARLSRISQMVTEQAPGRRILGLVAGVTGVGSGSADMVAMLAAAFAAPEAGVRVVSDVEIAYRAAFAPGEGYLVYAGTGSIAAFIDAQGVLHRAGGRGVALDDAGGGYWIAREALRRLWRREDERPGAWRDSPLARRLFPIVGGDSSINAARFLMERDRGDIGMLAIAVAACAGSDTDADTDEIASAIMIDAGAELARLANAMLARYGLRPIVVAGRAAQLHRLIEVGMRSHIAVEAQLTFRHLESHRAAAAMALQIAALNSQPPSTENRT